MYSKCACWEGGTLPRRAGALAPVPVPVSVLAAKVSPPTWPSGPAELLTCTLSLSQHPALLNVPVVIIVVVIITARMPSQSPIPVFRERCLISSSSHPPPSAFLFRVQLVRQAGPLFSLSLPTSLIQPLRIFHLSSVNCFFPNNTSKPEPSLLHAPLTTPPPIHLSVALDTPSSFTQTSNKRFQSRKHLQDAPEFSGPRSPPASLSSGSQSFSNPPPTYYCWG